MLKTTASSAGFTGQYVVEELHHVIHNESKSYTYAVAGRSASKVQGMPTLTDGHQFSSVNCK